MRLEQGDLILLAVNEFEQTFQIIVLAVPEETAVRAKEKEKLERQQ